MDAACFSCIPQGKKLDVLIWLFAQIAMATTDPQTLLQDAKCMWCIPEGKKMDVLLSLACIISGGGGGSGGIGQIVYYSGVDPNSDGTLPVNQNAAAIAIKPGATTYVWDRVNHVWT